MGLLTAIGTLTIIPVPQAKYPNFGKAVLFFPLVGLGIGMVLLGVIRLWGFLFAGVKIELSAAILVGISSLITGGIHLDGLGDFLDSLAGKDKKRRLEIMKDKYMGAYGTIGIGLCLLLKYVGIKGLIEGNSTFIILPFLTSRTCLSYLSSNLPYARDDGTGKPFVEGSRPVFGWLAFLCAGIISFIFGPKGLAIVVLGLFLSLCLRMYFLRMYGGITGDLLGATNEMMELLGLVSLNLLP